MNNEVTIKYLQNPATKGWLWKLYDATGSVIARSQAEVSTEAEAVADFEAWQANGDATVNTAPAPLPESAPVAPVQPVTPEEADGKITKEEIHDLEVKTPEGATEYELVNKETGEVVPTTGTTFGEGYVEFATEKGAVRFDNANKDGNLVDSDLSNPEYAVRQVGTHLTPNNDGVVNNDGVELNPVEGSVN